MQGHHLTLDAELAVALCPMRKDDLCSFSVSSRQHCKVGSQGCVLSMRWTGWQGHSCVEGLGRNLSQHWGYKCVLLREGMGAHSMVQAAQQPQRQVLADAHVAVEGHAWIHAGTGELVDDVLCKGRLSIVRQRRNYSCALGRRQQDMPKAPWCPDGLAQPLTSPAHMA